LGGPSRKPAKAQLRPITARIAGSQVLEASTHLLSRPQQLPCAVYVLAGGGDGAPADLFQRGHSLEDPGLLGGLCAHPSGRALHSAAPSFG